MRDRAEDDESHLKRVARRPAPIKNADKANSGGNQKKKNQKKSGNFQVPWPVPAGPSGQKGRRTGIRLPSELCVCVCVRLSLSPSECVSYSVVSPRLSVC